MLKTRKLLCIAPLGIAGIVFLSSSARSNSLARTSLYGSTTGMGEISAIVDLPDSAVSDGTSNEAAWSNPGNVKSMTDSYACAIATGGGVTQKLKCTNFGFGTAISSTDTILGVGVELAGAADSCPGGTANTGSECYARLIVGGVLRGATVTKAGTLNGGSTLACNISPTFPGMPDSSGDPMWGFPWTDPATSTTYNLTGAEVGASNFGVAFWRDYKGTGATTTTNIDYVMVSVSYTNSAARGKVLTATRRVKVVQG